jgi:ribosomal protein S27E
MSSKEQIANVKCPKCGHETPVQVPQNACLPVYKCDRCEKMIHVPAGSDNCCVVCEYSDDECPFPNKHKGQSESAGYELNDKDIEDVLKNLKEIQPDASQEDAIRILLETKMEVRDMTPEQQSELQNKYKKQNSDESESD